MLSQGDDFTRLNTSELKNMVSIHISLVCMTLSCTFPAPIFKHVLIISRKCVSRCGMLDNIHSQHIIMVWYQWLFLVYTGPYRSPFLVEWSIITGLKHLTLLFLIGKILLGRSSKMSSRYLITTLIVCFRFLSYHCLLYPQVNWCHNQMLHDYTDITDSQILWHDCHS